ncbi:hypothetical protein ABVT39_022683 [Epinephelus coioides]
MGLEVVEAKVCSRWGAPLNKSLSQDGDVIIGGLFNLYYRPSAVEQSFTKQPHYEPCTGLDLELLKYIYAMAFAVEEINRNSTLLPGVKLGYRILDSCARYPWALQVALSLVGGDTQSCNFTASVPHSEQPRETAGGQPVPLLIGPGTSTTTIILSRILGPLSVPVISYLASCPCLSDRLKFHNVFRTIPSDIYQARAMAQLAIRFHWTWMGAVIVNNDYGRLAVQAFQEETQGKGVCLEFIETVRRETIVSDARRTALTIQASTVRVILIFCWYTEAKKIFLELAKIHVTDRQFLASEAWSTSDDLLQDLAISDVASGVLGVAIRSSTIPGFESYLKSLHPIRRPDDEFLREFWEMEFECSPGATQEQASLAPCSGTESLEGVQNHFTDTSQLRVTYNVYLAVYAAAHALHSLLSCPDRDSSSRNNSSTCSSPKHIKPIELLQHLNKVNVTTPHGDMFYFQGADIPAKYDLVNWQNTPKGSLKLVLIGRVDGSDLHLNESAIQWSTGSNQIAYVISSFITSDIRLNNIHIGRFLLIADNDKSGYELISYLASCPCLSDRLKFHNVFRTIPSDIYQARAMAQLAIRFHWTWMGAVIENNDYGRLAVQAFQEENQGKGVCLEFIETVRRETIVSDARRTALTIQASTARVILIFCWYTEAKKVFLELAKIHVTDRQFLASEAWSTSDDLLQDLAISDVASGVLGVAIRSSTIPGFESYLKSMHPIRRPDDEFLREFWEMEFECSPGATQEQASLAPCSGTESLEGVQNHFTDTSQLRVTYNVYLAVYAAAHALHSLLSCPDRDSSPRNNSSTCSSPKHIKPIELLQHLNKVNVTTPHGDMFYFQGADIPAKYDLVNWQNTPEGSLKLVLIGRVDGSDLHLNESAIQWSTGSNQISYLASCPCLSDRLKFHNVFRTIPSDIYQARAMAQLAIRFHWTWMGAVIVNNDYGRLAVQAFQEETQGKGVCLEFIETVRRETIVSDARRTALTIQGSTARVILIFCWYTEAKKVFLELAKIHVTDRQFLASEAWSTSDDLLQDLAISDVANGVLGVAICSSTIPGFESYLKSMHPIRRPDDEFLREFWEMEFECSPGATQEQASLAPCSGTESMEGVQNHFTDTSQLRVTYNVYLAVYAAAHALHSLLSCPDRDSSSRNNSSTCSSPKHIKPIELLQHLNKVNVTTPHGDMFYFQGADIPAKYDLVNWQNTPKGSLKLVLIGRVDGSDLHLNESAIQWSTGSNQVVTSTSCLPSSLPVKIHKIMSWRI